MPVGASAAVRSHGIEYSIYGCLARTVALSLSCLVTVLLVFICVPRAKPQRSGIIIGTALAAVLVIALAALYCERGLNEVLYGQEKFTRLLGYLLLVAALTSLVWAAQLKFRQLNLLFAALLLTLLCLSTLSAWSSYDDGNGAVTSTSK